MIDQILEGVQKFNDRIAFLKSQSDYWPKVYLKNFPNSEVAASTILRVERNGVWYAQHFVEFMVSDSNTVYEILLEKIQRSVWAAYHLLNVDESFKFPNGDPVFVRDVLQISEEERLRQLMEEKK
jgi:hypothetical protein